jgi:3-hydroxyisobutyrate dehydrogenase
MSKTIAVIGTGIMGSGIVNNFIKNKYKVIVWNRTKSKLSKFKNVEIADTPCEASKEADIVFEITANDESSQNVWLGKKGILAGSSVRTVLISSATISKDWVDSLAVECRKAKRIFFDMPLTGGRIGAETSNLVLLVGGDEKELHKIRNELNAISKKIFYFGKAGSGIRFKLLLNMLQGIHIVALGEALTLADEIGLDIKKAGEAFTERPGGTATNTAWRDYQNDPDPINFSVEWITKDLTYAKKMAGKVRTPLLDQVLNKYGKLVKKYPQRDWTYINRFKD